MLEYKHPLAMSATWKKYFVPHRENNFKPHILHAKRAVLYSSLFVLMKMIVVAFVILLPVEAFLLPDVLAEQERKIISLTNFVRWQKGLPELTVMPRLTASADAKAMDMVAGQYFSHTGPNNRSLAYFLSQASYRYRVAGENLAMGFPDAESVVNAWIKSPTHYANLVDGDYQEIGVGLESGYYNKQPTVYVAQHFGLPIAVAVLSKPVEQKTGDAGTVFTARPATDRVRGQKISAVPPPASAETAATVDKQTSFVSWQEESGATLLTVQASIAGPVRAAVVYVNNYPIELQKQADGSYAGQFTVHEPADNLFTTVIMPTIKITMPDGAVVQDAIPWKTIKLVSKTPFQKYFQAKKLLRPLTSLFTVSRSIYIGFLVFFSLALLINIVVEIRRQHYQVIVQTLLMILLLAWFVYV